MEFNYDYGTHQWVLSIMVGFFVKGYNHSLKAC